MYRYVDFSIFVRPFFSLYQLYFIQAKMSTADQTVCRTLSLCVWTCAMFSLQ